MRAVISGAAVGLLTVALVASPVRGQPAPQPDFKHATELYKSATAALNEGRFAEAARDYGAAYQITRDPVLFFKIGVANEKSGRCDIALIYYGRYLREAKPDATYTQMTRERITACGGDAAEGASPHLAAAGSAAPPSAGTTTTGAAAVIEPGRGSATSDVTVDHGHGRDGAWLLVGGSLAFVTAGAVLAYSASSAEQDLMDLYVTPTSTPPTFDARTAQRYRDLIDDGHRYQYLSWTSFGVAGAMAIGAVILFAHGDHGDEKLSLRPIVTPREAGVAATVRF